MKCSAEYCREHIDGDIRDILERGWGWCVKGHRTDLPGNTKGDVRCDCGARATNQPGHSWWCREFKGNNK